MYKNEQVILKKYLDWCESFNIPPVSDAEKTIAEYARDEPRYKPSKNKSEVLEHYYRVCKQFNRNPSEYIEKQSTSYIMCLMLSIVNNAISKKYNEKLAAISDLIVRGYVIDCITALYDQEIYHISEENFERFLNCGQNKTDYKIIYEECGGDPQVFPLFSPYRDAEYCSFLEDDDNGYEENIN